MVVHACNPLALGKWKQEDQKFKVSLSYIATQQRQGALFCDDENVLEMNGSDGCMPHKYTKVMNYLRVNFIINKLYGLKKLCESRL